jgi:pentatricopeptide repeat protein
VQAFVQAGQPLRARAVLDKARREGYQPDVVSYTSLMQGLAAARHPAAAEGLLDEMQAQGVAPNLVSR